MRSLITRGNFLATHNLEKLKFGPGKAPAYAARLVGLRKIPELRFRSNVSLTSC